MFGTAGMSARIRQANHPSLSVSHQALLYREYLIFELLAGVGRSVHRRFCSLANLRQIQTSGGGLNITPPGRYAVMVKLSVTLLRDAPTDGLFRRASAKRGREPSIGSLVCLCRMSRDGYRQQLTPVGVSRSFSEDYEELVVTLVEE